LWILLLLLATCDAQAVRLRTAQPGLLKAAEKAAAAASMAERIELNAAAEQRKAKIRQEEVCTATAAMAYSSSCE